MTTTAKSRMKALSIARLAPGTLAALLLIISAAFECHSLRPSVALPRTWAARTAVVACANNRRQHLDARKSEEEEDGVGFEDFASFASTRRTAVKQQVSRLAFLLAAGGGLTANGGPAEAAAAATGEGGGDEGSMYAPKFVQEYADFTQSPEGWSYRDVSAGKSGAPEAKTGDRVVYDWSGYTIGYFGRPFQAKGGPTGGAFDKDLDYERTVLGSGKIVKGLESALLGMRPGGVRQVVVPYGKLSYPADDDAHDRVGPKPSTFSGQRALNFVLDNPRIDRTLLFNVKVVRVDKPDGKGGFVRGDK